MDTNGEFLVVAKNIPKVATDNDIIYFFSLCGPIKSVRSFQAEAGSAAQASSAKCQMPAKNVLIAFNDTSAAERAEKLTGMPFWENCLDVKFIRPTSEFCPQDFLFDDNSHFVSTVLPTFTPEAATEGIIQRQLKISGKAEKTLSSLVASETQHLQRESIIKEIASLQQMPGTDNKEHIKQLRKKYMGLIYSEHQARALPRTVYFKGLRSISTLIGSSSSTLNPTAGLASMTGNTPQIPMKTLVSMFSSFGPVVAIMRKPHIATGDGGNTTESSKAVNAQIQGQTQNANTPLKVSDDELHIEFKTEEGARNCITALTMAKAIKEDIKSQFAAPVTVAESYIPATEPKEIVKAKFNIYRQHKKSIEDKANRIVEAFIKDLKTN